MKVKPINSELLSECVKKCGYNYMQLADIINISRSTIHNILAGRTNPSYYVINCLALSLNLTDEDIITIFFPNKN